MLDAACIGLAGPSSSESTYQERKKGKNFPNAQFPERHLLSEESQAAIGTRVLRVEQAGN